MHGADLLSDPHCILKIQAGNGRMLSMLDLPQVIGRLHRQPHTSTAEARKFKTVREFSRDAGVPVDDGRQLSTE